jgi:AAA domain
MLTRADPPPPDLEFTADDLGIQSIVWPDFWSSEQPAEDWLIPPIVASGRQTAIYSQPKQGKSLLALDVAVAAATGRSILGQPAVAPKRICYLDLEMTPADLRERLIDLGYGPEDDLTALSYYQLQSLPPLDTDLGGEVLLSIATNHAAALVVIDTMARAVSGEENSADTYRRFYAYTGRRLKAAGVSLLRLDHQGKDAALGQRGSSAKDDDLDVVFRLTCDDLGRVVLKRTRSRVAWIPTEIVIQRQDEPLRHVLASDSWPAGTAETAEALDELGVLEDATCEIAITALKRAGKGRRKAVVLAALRFRKTSR